MQGKLKETVQKEKRTTSVTILDGNEEMEEAEMSTVKKGKGNLLQTCVHFSQKV